MINIIGEDIKIYRDKSYLKNEFFFDYQKKKIKQSMFVFKVNGNFIVTDGNLLREAFELFILSKTENEDSLHQKSFELVDNVGIVGEIQFPPEIKEKNSKIRKNLK